MKLEEFMEIGIESVLRTEYSPEILIDSKLLHSILGIIDEAGELVKIAKNIIYYQSKFDIVNFEEELGDLWWFYRLALLVLAKIEEKSVTEVFIKICDMNASKLLKRYPEGFSADKALNKDIEEERKALESDSRKEQNEK